MMLNSLQTMPFSGLLAVSTSYIFLRWLLFCPAFEALRLLMKGSRSITSERADLRQLRSEIFANIRVNVVDSIVLTLPIYYGWVHAYTCSWASFGVGYAFSYVFFEIWFYWVHRLLHTPRFRWIHRQHHFSRVTTSFSALSLSVPEKMLNVTGMYLIPCIVSNFIPLAFEGIVAYHMVNFLVNVLGHSNIELLPIGHERTWIGKVFATSTYHSIHHLRGHQHFGLFTSVLDRIFGTYDHEYPALYRKSVESR